jgi:hypothetical protein
MSNLAAVQTTAWWNLPECRDPYNALPSIALMISLVAYHRKPQTTE